MKTAMRVMAAVLAMGMTGAAMAQYGYAPRYVAPQYGVRAWDAPPAEFREFQRQGYLDGVQGAERDFENHRIWNVENRDEFRHPHVPGEFRADYKDGFQRGYYATVQHFEGLRGR